MKILITTPMGNVGLATLRKLTQHPSRLALTVVAGVRNPAQSFPELASLTDAVVPLDFARPDTFDAALAEVSRVLLVRPPELADVDKYFRPFVQAMQRANVSQVVFLSLQGVENNQVTPHYRIEKLIREAGLGSTMLRPSFFMQNLSTTHCIEIRDHSEIFVPAGNGRTSFVDVRDLADVAVQALATGLHRNTAYELTGAEALTYTEVAAILTNVLGRTITYTNPSVLHFVWQKVVQEKMKLGYVLIMVALYSVAKLGKAAGLTDTLAELLGHPPTKLKQFAEDTKAVWLPTVKTNSIL